MNQEEPLKTGSGEVVEWLKAPHSKCGILARVSWVQIPPSPPDIIEITRVFRLSRGLPQHPSQRVRSHRSRARAGARDASRAHVGVCYERSTPLGAAHGDQGS